MTGPVYDSLGRRYRQRFRGGGPQPRPPAEWLAFEQSQPEEMTTYDFPLRRDLVVPCTLPVRLTAADAERLERFVRALAQAP